MFKKSTEVIIIVLTLLVALLTFACAGPAAGKQLSAISVTPQMLTEMEEGTTRQMTATGVYSDGSRGDLTGNATWAVSDPTIGTITPTGLLYALKVGKATITATYKGVTGSAPMVVVVPTLPGGAPKPKPITMPKYLVMQGGSSPGSTSDLYTQALQQLLNKFFPELEIRRIPGGTKENLVACEEGTSQFCPIGVYNVAWPALQGTLAGYEGRKFTHERSIGWDFMGNMGQAWAVLKDSPIKDLSDLKNKRIFVGASGSSSYVANEVLLQYYGFNYTTIKANGGLVLTGDVAEAAGLLAAGQIDAWNWGTVHPYAGLITANLQKGIRFIDASKEALTYLEKNLAGMGYWVMPAGTYEGQTKDAIGFTYLGMGLVRDDLSDDVVYNICAAMYAQKNFMEGIHIGWKGSDLVAYAYHRPVVGFPIQPGALKYWADRGITLQFQPGW